MTKMYNYIIYFIYLQIINKSFILTNCLFTVVMSTFEASENNQSSKLEGNLSSIKIVTKNHFPNYYTSTII